MLQKSGKPIVLCVNKCDGVGDPPPEFYEFYNLGLGEPIAVSSVHGHGTGDLLDAVYQYLDFSDEGEYGEDSITVAIVGRPNAGKSSLVNCLQSGTVMETGSISEKIERGKHTTRHSELISIAQDTYILDTPGFSSLGLFRLEKEQLAEFYPEFAPFEKYCRFGGCSHISEPVCGIKAAVAEGEIPQIRYENYCLLYDELKNQRKY